MSKKIDLSKLLTKGSAKQRAALLIYHYTILEAIELNINKEVINFTETKPILTEIEARAIFNSFKDAREIKVYNDYRELNIKILEFVKQFGHKKLIFERDYYKYLYWAEVIKKENKIKDKTELYTVAESMLIHSYTEAINFYHAIKIFAKEKGYTNKYILTVMDTYLKSLHNVYDTYLIEMNNEKTIKMKLSDIEPNYNDIKQVLYEDFDIDNSQILEEYFNNTDEKEPK
jgi:hypothetical protein